MLGLIDWPMIKDINFIAKQAMVITYVDGGLNC